MGAVVACFATRIGSAWDQNVRLFLTTGILGGFTTFSAFSLDAVALWERGDPVLAAAYVAGSVLLAIAGAVAGLAVVRALA
jgi:CrcB protein